MLLTLPEFLTEEQIAQAVRLYQAEARRGRGYARERRAVEQILTRVIEPNMAAINAKLGKEHDPEYLAYSVIWVLWCEVRGVQDLVSCLGAAAAPGSSRTQRRLLLAT